MTLGEYIRNEREAQGYTLRSVAKAIRVSAAFLSDLEKDRRKTNKLPEIAKALSIPLDRLQELDSRLPQSLKDWIERDPKLRAILEQIRNSKRTPDWWHKTILRMEKKA